VSALPVGCSGGVVAATTATGSDGTYVLNSLPPGSYILELDPGAGPYAEPQYYSGTTSYTSALPVDVSEGQAQTGVNDVLVGTGTVTGTVTNTSGAPVSNINVQVIGVDAQGNDTGTFASTVTGPDGTYSIDTVAEGKAIAYFSDPNETYAYQWYNNQVGFSGNATPFQVTSGGTTAGIDADMSVGGGFSGTVAGPGGTPLPDIDVLAFPVGPGSGSAGYYDDLITTTGADGTYSVAGLPSGHYQVSFQDPRGQYALQVYNNAASDSDATAVSVTAPASTDGIDADLAIGGKISGTVTDAGGAPVSGVSVLAFSSDDGVGSSFATTGSDGSYTVGGLGADDYDVEFSTPNGLEYYPNTPDSGSATPVSVVAGQTTAGIDEQETPGCVGEASTTTTLTADVNPADAGQNVTLTATVTGGAEGSPSGSVAFFDGGSELGSDDLGPDGTATFSTSTLAPGTHSLTAVYSGDGDHGGSTSNTLDEIINGGSISGQVTTGSPAAGVEGAYVYACDDDNFCQSASTDSDGDYTVSNLEDGSYTVTAYPPSGDSEVPASTGPVTISDSNDVTGEDVALVAPTPMPSGTAFDSPTFGNETSGAPEIEWADVTPFTTTGCPNATAATLGISTAEGGAIDPPITLTETPAGSGTYTGSIDGPDLLEGSHHGAATFTVTLTCPTGPAQTASFDGYVDPSGQVVDTHGNPIAGVTVTLFSATGTPGFFAGVPNGSAQMSPANRTNPQTTPTDGSFGWDVAPGSYEVEASKAGCVSAANPAQATAQSPVLTVPPAVTGVTLTLSCPTGGGGGSGGGGGGGGTTTTTTPPAASSTVTRVAGPDRIGTSVALSQATYAPAAGPAGGLRTAKTVVIADADNYPDALVGAPLAVAKGGPVLLTSTGTLDPRVQAEIQRLLPSGSTVYVIGGTYALAPAISDAITALGYTVVRYAGADRYGTAVAVAGALGDPGTDLVATGTNFPDALAAAAAAAANHDALLLTNGATLPAETAAYLVTHPHATVMAVGGPAATALPAVTALTGPDRYATAIAVAQHFFPSPTTVGIADGLNFPDAITGGTNIATLGGPLLLTDPNTLSTATQDYLQQQAASITTATIYGGTLAISTTVQQAVQQAL
jgi:putative cell wall-binding protein